MLLQEGTYKAEITAAIDDRGDSITYGELVEEGKVLASHIPLRAVVFCLCENTVGSLIGFIGCYDNGRIPLLLDEALDRGLLSTLMEKYTPAMLWVPRRAASEFPYELVYEAHDYALLKTGHEVYPVNEQLSMLLTTSGSTGCPKLVRHKYGNIEANARNVAVAFGWTIEERPICSLPMNYTMGLNVINTHLYTGCTLLLTSASLASPLFWDFIKRERGSNFTGVPFSYEIFSKLRFQRMKLPYLTTLASGGGKLTDKMFLALADYAQEQGKRFIPSFGTTETSARLARLEPQYVHEKVNSIGKAIPEGELMLLDENGNVLPEGEADGELCYRGPNVTMGYAECREDLLLGDVFCGEYRTGDLAHRDADGFYYITGRLKRFVKIYGLRISLDQCEQLIRSEFTLECACTGDDSMLRVYLVDPAMAETVKVWVCKTLHLAPTAVTAIVLPDIPKSSSGKTAYSQLK